MSLREALSSGIFLQSIGLVGLLIAERNRTETPAVGSSLEKLRQDHQVQLIDRSVEGSGIASAPAGVYGFTYAPATESPLFATKSYRSFEMHKARDGASYLVGYVTGADLEAVRAGGEVKLFPDQYENATELVSLPLSRINTKNRQPSRSEGCPLSVTVSEIP